jgi:hypothetical protein
VRRVLLLVTAALVGPLLLTAGAGAGPMGGDPGRRFESPQPQAGSSSEAQRLAASSIYVRRCRA